MYFGFNVQRYFKPDTIARIIFILLMRTPSLQFSGNYWRYDLAHKWPFYKIIAKTTTNMQKER